MPNDPGRGAPLLEVTDLHKRYGGVHALRGASLDIRAGEVHALVGENGAGKSTLINILAGAVRRDAGRVVFAGRDVDFHSPAQSQAAGIAVIHQELATLPTLSVVENLLMGRMPARAGWLDRAGMRALARDQLGQVGLEIDPWTRMRDLSLSQQQQVEIARALFAGATLLVMDEPSSALTEHEARRLVAIVRDLRSRGVATLYVSHRMAEVFRVADRITVYRDGERVGTQETASTTPATIVRMMVGRQLAAAAPNAARQDKDVILAVRGLTRRPRRGGAGAAELHDVTFTVRRGEIVGMAGLVGAGRSEVARAIFGADEFDAGEILLDGRAIHFRSPADAIGAGVAMVPEDRKALALFLEKPVRWNLSMVRLPRLARAGFVRRAREQALATEQLLRLRIKAANVEAPVRSLSGGNQQKTVLARWLVTRPTLLLLDEPTHGVDVGAKAEIYGLIRALARDGVAILLISSELPEVLDLSDRILVMREGRVAAMLDRADADEHTVMLHATGTSA